MPITDAGSLFLTGGSYADGNRRCDEAVYERGWITTRDGNISMRKRDGKYLYITVWMAEDHCASLNMWSGWKL